MYNLVLINKSKKAYIFQYKFIIWIGILKHTFGITLNDTD